MLERNQTFKLWYCRRIVLNLVFGLGRRNLSEERVLDIFRILRTIRRRILNNLER